MFGQVPLFYNHKKYRAPVTGREMVSKIPLEFIWMYPMDPLYPFGYGISYTTFSYSDVKLSNASMKPGKKLPLRLHVTNYREQGWQGSGAIVYPRPGRQQYKTVKEIKRVSKNCIERGESKTVSF
jgi:beta-glucosidase